MTQEIVSDRISYTNPTGQTLFANALAGMFTSVFPNYFGPLINNGVIWSRIENASFFTYMSIARFNTVRGVENNGLIVLESPSSAGGRTIAFDNTNLNNTGDLYVLAHGASAATGVNFTNQVFNSGLIAVRSEGGSATGLYHQNGGSLHNTATGRLLVEGVRATAVYWYGGADNNAGIRNEGLIEARATGDDYSFGIISAHLHGRTVVYNSGTIRADIAYLSAFGTSAAAPFVDNITNTATGRIEGAILMDRGDDIITNAGVIVGTVLMEEGDDLIDNRGGGVIQGLVDLGWGDDRYYGGANGDRVIGGNGADVIDGGAGDDLLMGGSGNDTLTGGLGADGLFGEYGDDLIITRGQDFVWGGHGDDRIEAGDFAFETIDGGAGFDTVVFNGGARALDLSIVLAQGGLHDIEAMVLTGGQSMAIRAADIAAVTGGDSPLYLTTTSTDRIDLVGAWVSGATQMIGGVSYRTFTLDGQSVLVAGSGQVTPNAAASGGGLDALTGPLAPVPGAESGVDFTSNVVALGEYELHQDVVVPAEQTWFTSYGWLLVSYRDVSITNYGQLVIDVPAGPPPGNFSAPRAISNTSGTVTNHGLISVQSAASVDATNVWALYLHETLGTLDNRSLITAGSVHGDAHGFFGGTLLNSGLIEVEAGRAARGATVRTELENTGVITAHSNATIAPDTYPYDRPASIGVLLMGPGAGPHVNHGTITATSTVAGGATGVLVESVTFMPNVFINTGTITADIAIEAQAGTTASTGILHLTNSGQLNGRIELVQGADRIVNTGTINGVVNMGAGADFYDGRGGVQIGTIFGGDGDDVIWAGAGDDRISGGAGADTIDGGEGIDTVIFSGPRSSYTFSVNGGTVTVSGPDGVDTLTGVERFLFSDGLFDLAGNMLPNPISGSALADVLAGTDGYDVIDGGAGDDRIIPLGGNDQIDGGAGRDTVVIAGAMAQSTLTYDGEVTIVTGPGGVDRLINVERIQFNDGVRIAGANGGSYITGGAGADTLTDTALNDEIEAGAGDDVIHLTAGDDFVDGGAGFDRVNLAFSRAGYVLTTDGVTTTVAGAASRFTVTNVERIQFSDGGFGLGTSGADTLNGVTGAQGLYGFGGDDIMHANQARNHFDGGDGSDTVSYNGYFQNSGVTVYLAAGWATGVAGETDTLVSVENIIGTGHADTMYGDAQANRFAGQSGADILFGAGGSDRLEGGFGNDVLVGNDDVFFEETDTLLGGEGDDLIYGERVDVIDGGSGFDRLIAVNAYDWTLDLAATSIEYAVMDFGDDVITAANQTVGVSVFASGGNDTVDGSAFADLIFGGVGDDVITGGAGDDAIVGDLGADQLSGRDGDDRIYFDRDDTLVSGGAGYDAGYITIAATSGGVTIDLAIASLEFIQDLAGGDDVITGATLTVGFSAFTGAGADTVTGSAFDDILWGEGGDDILSGNAGADVLVGGAGADRLSGGAGVDNLYAGAADGQTDVFVFEHVGADHRDFIHEFELAHDRIDLSAFAGATFADVSIVEAGGHSHVALNGQAVAIVADVTGLTAANFIFAAPGSEAPAILPDIEAKPVLDDADVCIAPQPDLPAFDSRPLWLARSASEVDYLLA